MVVAKLTRIISNPKTTASDINTVLSADPGLVAKILKLVNSSYYGFSRRITTITNAVVILGFSQVRNLAISAFVFDAFADSGKDSRFDVNGFWKHSIGTAFISSGITRKLAPKIAENAFICGLLHDLGKFIMAQNASNHMSLVLDTVYEKDILFCQAEAEQLDYNHAILGAAAMEKWNLPEVLVEAVRHHHAPLEAPDNSRMLACAANIADIAARAFLMGSSGDRRIPILTREVWNQIGLNWPEMEAIVRGVATEYAESNALFSIK